ncbi:protein cft1 [Diplogelasinospora grovesii]|uniref:Protein CFT1 n=1 Tax=Diplogelasinospora grovesii TaxID=303347 RepID=A0AAN6NCZ1_9PEZI|nr:protein cft1 [Diplogelasinospora grovesii]
MQCYTELTPPTAVTHSLILQFVPGQGTNLVVAKSSLLQIFKTKIISTELDTPPTDAPLTRTARRYESRLANDDEGLEASFLGGDNPLTKTDRANSTKLVLIAETPLPGTITGLARIKTPHKSSWGGDALLIAFKDARLSLVEWDAERHALKTVSIHYYEQDELQGSPWAAPLSHYANVLTADPGSRCAALKFGARNLAILPFRQADEDIDMGDWDEELDGARPTKDLSGAVISDGSSNIEETPYSPSFVLRLSNLDPNLLHPVHLAFLHEYREPTFGILSSTKSPSNSLGRRDHFSYMVFTLDLQQKASTTILSVSGLPQDLFRVVALPAPVGGALLVGANELIHIDQSGKPNGVAVNPLTKQCTSFSLVDQSDLNLRLEGCIIDVLTADQGELLIILNDGRMALVTFRIDGRTVSGLEVKMVPSEAGGSIIPCRVASLSRVGRNTMFAGIEEGDSLVFGWTRKQNQKASRRKTLIQESLDLDLDEDGDLDLDLEDDDDLYAEEAPTAQQQARSLASSAKNSGDLSFRIHDRLLSIAPIQKMTYGEPCCLPGSEEDRNSAGVRSDLQLVCAVGRDKSASIAIMNLEIQPRIIGRFEFPEARGLWTMSAKKPVPKSLQGEKGGNAVVANDYDTSGQYHKFMIVAKVDLDGYETSDVFALTAAGFESLSGTEFEPAAGFTVEAGTMGKERRIVQVLKSEVRCYDGNLGLAQILPMLDEETGAEPRAISASIADPFLLLIRDDSSVFIAQIDSNNELEELEKEDMKLLSTKWLTGCLYKDTHSIFADEKPDKTAKTEESIMMFLLSSSGALHIYRLPDLSNPVYVAEGLSYIPPGLSADYAARKGTTKETITEILVADLGDTTYKSPYLILRHGNDDLTLYEPFRYKNSGPANLSNTLFFRKLPNSTFAKSPEEAAQDDATHQLRFLPMRPCSNVGGYSTVFLPGASASFILKSAKSMPRVIGLRGSGVQAMSSFHTEGCEHGFIYADSHGIARVTQLPGDYSYAELGLSCKKIPVGTDISSIAYHPPTQSYVLGCNTTEPFELPKDDDYHKEWSREQLPPSFHPTGERGSLRLYSPITWTMIDEVQMEPCESILCVETLNLEISESTNERKQLVAVGTALCKGEDLPTRGHVYVYDIAEVIPEPGRPETNKKLKLVAKEDIPRGAVTGLSAVGTQGLMLVAQGQKCMVRGLKEDGTLLPVAFMDMNCYVTSVKELSGTGLCLMADAFKGVWFTGYTEEPYKMILFGKSNTRLEVLNADFLPDGKELFIIVGDAESGLNVLQFDPEHPKSLQGHLLLHRTTFNTGAHVVTSSLLLPTVPPPTPSPSQAAHTNGDPTIDPSTSGAGHVLLMASPTGVLAALRPLSENAYRRLSSLATQLTTSLPHAAGLNPKGYRVPSPTCAPAGVDAGMGRSIVDGLILERYTELNTGRRGEVAGRAGYGGAEEIRGELQGVLGWAGLTYF